MAHPAWQKWKYYKVGDMVDYRGTCLICVIDHIADFFWNQRRVGLWRKCDRARDH